MNLKGIKSGAVLLWMHVVVFLVVMLMCGRFGEAHWLGLCIGFVVAYGLPAVLCRILVKEWSCSVGILLLVSALIMAFGVCQNLSTYVLDLGTFSEPGLGTTDAARDFSATLEYMSGKDMLPLNMGWPLLMAGLFKLTGVNIAYPMLLNMTFTLGTIIFGGLICQEAFPDRNRSKTLFWGVFMTASVSSILFYGTILMKDAGVTLGMSAVGLTLMQSSKGCLRKDGVVSMCFGCALLALLKSPMGYFLLIGCITILITKKRKKMLLKGLVGCAMAAAVVLSGQWLRYSSDMSMISADQAEATTHYMFDYLPNTERYASLIPDYYSLSVGERMLLLPFTASAQYFPPFPWNFTRDLHMGGFYWYPHIVLGWYLLGGLIIGYFCLLWWRKNDGELSRWALWILLCYLAVAYVSAGSVARYYLPFIPLAVPLAMQMIFAVKDGMVKTNRVKICGVLYGCLLCVALAASYIFLKL